MDEQRDLELIEQARKGNARAFEELVNTHYRTIFKMAFKYCGNQSDAEDITQDACMKLARGLDSFKGDSAFTSWLYRLVINCAKDYFKKSSRHPSGAENLELAQKPDRKEDRLYAKEVLAAVYDLPAGEKDALLLVMSEGFSHAEAAKALGCKESTISWRIHEARKKLAAQFEKDEKYG